MEVSAAAMQDYMLAIQAAQAVPVVGGVGAGIAGPDEWNCLACGSVQSKRRLGCSGCGKPRPIFAIVGSTSGTTGVNGTATRSAGGAAGNTDLLGQPLPLVPVMEPVRPVLPLLPEASAGIPSAATTLPLPPVGLAGVSDSMGAHLAGVPGATVAAGLSIPSDDLAGMCSVAAGLAFPPDALAGMNAAAGLSIQPVTVAGMSNTVAGLPMAPIALASMQSPLDMGMNLGGTAAPMGMSSNLAPLVMQTTLPSEGAVAAGTTSIPAMGIHPKAGPGDWICGTCNDLQFARNVTCRSCGAPRSRRGAAAQQVAATPTTTVPTGLPALQKTGDWICTTCGDLQFARNKQCRRCGTPRPNDGVSGTPWFAEGGDWLCPNCGDLQFKRNTACRKCKLIRPKNDKGVTTVQQPIEPELSREAEELKDYFIKLHAHQKQQKADAERERAEVEINRRSVRISNPSPTMTEESILTLFKDTFESVVQCTLHIDPATQRKLAKVEFESVEEAKKAVTKACDKTAKLPWLISLMEMSLMAESPAEPLAESGASAEKERSRSRSRPRDSEYL